MSRPSDRTCYPAADAPPTTDLVAHCQVCGVQWAVQDSKRGDAKGCSFCDAPENAITIVSEAPDYGGLVIR